MKHSFQPRTAWRRLAQGAALCALLARVAPAGAQTKPAEKPPETATGQAPGFLCLGESESIMRGSRLDEIAHERDERLRALAADEVPRALQAHTHCVIAELMRRLGDARAEGEYERAIELNPSEPAYELWYGRYMQWSRGASSPLTEEAEGHYYATLDKLQGHSGLTQNGSTDATAREWTQHNLSLLYQEDGLPLLPWQWKAFPYGSNAKWAPQLTFSFVGSIARDTTDFWEATDSRRFTLELQNAVERRQAGGPLVTKEEARGIARAPLRWDTQTRLRLRERLFGELDATYRRAKLIDSQITDFSKPNQFNDVNVEEVDLHVRRTFDLYPLFDLMLDGGYSLQKRTGVVESFPDLTENVKIAQINASASRYIGPDKLTLGGTYVHFDIPDSPGGGPENARERVIRAAFIDYAVYRPLLLPQLQKGTFSAERKTTRGFHFFGSAIWDDEEFGRSVVHKRNFSGGTALKGWEDYNFTLVGTYQSAGVTDNGLDDPYQQNSQWRTNLTIQRRLLDEEANPGFSKSGLAAMSLALPIRHDFALTGLKEYENVRAGLELWSKFFSEGARGTSFLVNVGVDYQYFYNIDKSLVSARIEARMGWPSFGNIPTFF